MTMLGSAMVVGQAIGAVTAGQVAASAGAQTALVLPVAAAALVLIAGVANALRARARRAAD